VALDLRIVAPDARGLAAGEKALALALGARQCELVWTPPDEYATPVAFIVVAGDLEIESGNDAFELLLIRSYRLTLTCLPHVRSIEAVTIEALPPFVAAPATLDDCTSVAGWTVDDPNTTLSVSGGVEVLIDHDQPPGPALFVTHPGGFTITERYLAIEQTGFGQVGVVGVTLNGSTALPLVGAEGGWRFYDADAYTGSPVTSLVFGFLGLKSGYPSWPDFTIATIAESATAAATTGRQSLRVLQVGGSAAVDASIAIEARNADADGGGDSLGTVYLYSGSNYDPRLSPSSLEYSGARATGHGRAVRIIGDGGRSLSSDVLSRPSPRAITWCTHRAKGTASATVTWVAAVQPRHSCRHGRLQRDRIQRDHRHRPHVRWDRLQPHQPGHDQPARLEGWPGSGLVAAVHAVRQRILDGRRSAVVQPQHGPTRHRGTRHPRPAHQHGRGLDCRP
jgi:hypothetical protein